MYVYIRNLKYLRFTTELLLLTISTFKTHICISGVSEKKISLKYNITICGLQPLFTMYHSCTGSGWDGDNFLHSSLYGAMV